MKKIGLILLLSLLLNLLYTTSTNRGDKMNSKTNCKLTYYGVSAFTMESYSTKIGIDFWHKDAFPYAEDISDHSEFDKSNIDKILITHDHSDHCYVPEGIDWFYAITDDDRIVDNGDFGQVGPFKIGAYYSQHFPEQAPPYPKTNTVFKITIDSLTFVHMGDAHGTMMNREQIAGLKKKVGDLDILLMPVGDGRLQNMPEEVWENTIKEMNPKAVIPIHYWSVKDKESFIQFCKSAELEIVNYESNIDFNKFDFQEKGKIQIIDLQPKKNK